MGGWAIILDAEDISWLILYKKNHLVVAEVKKKCCRHFYKIIICHFCCCTKPFASSMLCMKRLSWALLNYININVVWERHTQRHTEKGRKETQRGEKETEREREREREQATQCVNVCFMFLTVTCVCLCAQIGEVINSCLACHYIFCTWSVQVVGECVRSKSVV